MNNISKTLNDNLLIRIGVAIILLIHGLAGMFNDGVNNFGNLFLNQIGFAPFGLIIAWAVKISHVVCAISLIVNRFVIASSLITILILGMGIILVHAKDGWYVVGGGRNGVEFNFILILILLQFINDAYFKKNQQTS